VAGIETGNLGLGLKAGLLAAATAVAFWEVGNLTMPNGAAAMTPAQRVENIVGHALVGCGQAVASGGKCGPSALAGAVTSAAGPVINGYGVVSLVANAVVGGGAAVLGGGKFENGAITSAFEYLFNDAQHDRLKEGQLRHQAAVDQEIKDLLALGYDVEGTNVLAPGMPDRYYDIVAVDPSGQRLGIEVKTTIGDVFRINNQQIAFDVEALKGSAVTVAGPIGGVSYVGVSFGATISAYFARIDLARQAWEKGVVFYGRRQ
jgi:hypothetical protein